MEGRRKSGIVGGREGGRKEGREGVTGVAVMQPSIFSPFFTSTSHLCLHF